MAVAPYCGEAKATFTFRLKNYKNEGDILETGEKCDLLSALGDKCDPIFQTCITGQTECDVVNLSTEPFTVTSELAFVDKYSRDADLFQKTIQVKVTVLDSDPSGSNQKIAVFTTTFEKPDTTGKITKKMDVSPAGLNVQLEMELEMKCAPLFFGAKCDAYCDMNALYQVNKGKPEQPTCGANCGDAKKSGPQGKPPAKPAPAKGKKGR